MIKRTAPILVLIAICLAGPASAMWVKGNTHMHTTRSDGDASPAEAAAWYRDNGYDFVVITDHRMGCDPESWKGVPTDSFIVIPGEEVGADSDGTAVHITAMGVDETVPTIGKTPMYETLQGEVNSINEAGAIAIVNHPNYRWAMDHRMIGRIEGLHLMEIWNNGSGSNNSGDFAHLTTEQMWDILLSQGKRMYGVASDDTHLYGKPRKRKGPGGAWIMVNVKALTREEVMINVACGNFYATTGPILSDYSFDGKNIRIRINPARGIGYATLFIGKYGQVLREVNGTEASYTLTGNPSEAYVRAKIISSDGQAAWTQPVRHSN